ncbi:MSD2A [Auxenochlorella protothecoides x Auxenochlorella symbiontica]
MMSRTITLALFALALSSLSAPCDARVPSRDLLAFHGRSLLEFENITLPELPYEYSALEPVISAEIMELHHDKHHRSFLAGFNTAVAGLIAAQDSNNVASIVTLTSALNFNGGGWINHNLFWPSLTPVSNYTELSGPLGEAIDETWGSFDAFKTAFNTATIGIQGSGWGWLAVNPATGVLSITTTANQDALQPRTGLVPLFGVDVWEHAYYLQYYNVRADYVNAIWQIINWPEVEQRYATATA